MQYYQGSTQSIVDSAQYQEKNNRLKVYKIASYEHWWRGIFWGNYAIVRVPYEFNKSWDIKAKWDTVYFIIPERYLSSAE